MSPASSTSPGLSKVASAPCDASTRGRREKCYVEISILDHLIRNTWATHDFKVKMLDWSAARGSRLAYTCRLCGRRFCLFTIVNQGTWAVDEQGRALAHAVSARWLAEHCPRLPDDRDDEDRKLLSKPSAQ